MGNSRVITWRMGGTRAGKDKSGGQKYIITYIIAALWAKA